MKDIVPLRIFTYFLENPYLEMYLREIARKLKISPFAIKKYLDLFTKEKLILSEKRANLRYFKLNMSSFVVRSLKTSLNLKKILDSGLIDYLIKEIPALSSIILFGSCAKGEDSKESDIDIVIIGKEKKDSVLSLRAYEKSIGKEINYHFFNWHQWNQEYKNNKAFYTDVVVYGLSLYGELPLIQDGNTNS